MEKKLKIYSALLIGVALFFVLHSVIYLDWQDYSGSDERLEVVKPPVEFEKHVEVLDDGTVVRDYKPTITYDVNVKPNGITVGEFPDKKYLFSTVKDQTCKLTMQKIWVEVPASKSLFGSYDRWITYAVWSVTAIIIIWILCLVFKTLRNIRRGEVFVSEVARSIEITGMLLTFLYLFQLATSYIFTRYLMEHIKLADYHIVFKNEVNSMFIITGLALMILSQVILMGKDLKEEQELTI
ncbi:MAG: DUF2975 domain-containing protein [Bacteroidaceae bacterium]|nr:DUF2975 domain-containing protein [Bacteroidaceae bacterium]